MGLILAYISSSAPNCIQLVLNGVTGPFTQAAGPLGSFNPQRDLTVYIDGSRVDIGQAWFDSSHNQYLLFMKKIVSPYSVVQVVHHVPEPPFSVGATTLPGFATIATYNNSLGWGVGWGASWGGFNN